MTIRRHGRRFAWLMIGAAIGTTVVLVLGLGIPVGADDRTSPAVLGVGVAGAVLLGGLLGLVPGVRELEVTAARSMLGIETELVVPRRPGLIHRLQDVAWVQVHLLLGLVAAGCLTMLLPASVVLVLDAVRGAGADTVLPIPTGELGRVAAVGLGLLGAVVALIAAAPLGALAAHLAPRLLGPTARDRLEVALAKAEREADRIRIARDLHDGIGHDLTIVSIQASAGRRVLEHDPAATAQALERIESTAREALEELDAVLAQLRDEQTGKPSGRRNAAASDAADSGAGDSGAGGSGAAGSGAAGSGATGPQGTGPDAPGPERLASDAADPDSSAGGSSALDSSAPASRLEQVMDDHRAAGMDLRLRGALPSELSPLQGEHLVRIVGELLTNAHRHGAAGPVHLAIRAGEGPTGQAAMTITVENPRKPSAAADPSAHGGPSSPLDEAGPVRGGRGLTGMRERLELWGGTLEAGPDDGAWRARAVVPLLEERTQP